MQQPTIDKMMTNILLLLLLITLTITPVASFVAPTTGFVATKARCFTAPPLNLQRLGLASDLSTKEMQLDELEDKEECQTELWLNDDGTVTLGQTNGPQYSHYAGNWHVLETSNEQPFRMKLVRSYEVGVGDVTYDVEREFRGGIELVGESLSVSGKTHGNIFNDDDANLLDAELGFFAMIDSVASEGVEGEKRP